MGKKRLSNDKAAYILFNNYFVAGKMQYHKNQYNDNKYTNDRTNPIAPDSQCIKLLRVIVQLMVTQDGELLLYLIRTEAEVLEPLADDFCFEKGPYLTEIRVPLRVIEGHRLRRNEGPFGMGNN